MARSRSARPIHDLHSGMTSTQERREAISPSPVRGHLVALTAWSICCALIAASRPFDTDAWWHIRVGSWIAQHREIPSTDIFSWTSRSAEWRPSSWLFDWFLGVTHEALPSRPLLIGITFITFAAVAWSVYRASRRAGAGPWASVGATAAFEFLMIPYIAERPQMLSFLLFALVSTLVSRALRGDRLAFLGLLAVFILWANIHLSFTIGIALVAATALGYAIDARKFLLPSAVLGASILAGLLNPFGVNAYSATTDLSALSRVLDEWQHASIHEVRDVLIVLLAAAALASMIRTQRWRRLELLLPILALTAFFLYAIRNAPYLLILITPEIALGLSSLRSTRLARLVVPFVKPIRDGVFLSLLALILFSVTNAAPPRAVTSAQYPVKGVAAIPSKCRLLNEYSDGGYIIYERWPSVEVSEDGRSIGARSVLKQQSVMSGEPGALQWIDAKHVQCVLAHPDRGIIKLLEARGWTRASSEPSGVLLIRPGFLSSN